MLLRFSILLAFLLTIAANAAESIPEVYESDQYTTSHTSVHDPDLEDPLVNFNRPMFFINDVVDGLVLAPVSTAYINIVPGYARDRVSSVLDTMKQPVYFINYVARGNGDAAGHSLKRFLINATVGGAGLFNPAERLGYPGRPTDAGATMAHYCADAGPYLVLPLIGPSSMRDASGKILDQFGLDPWQHTLPRRYVNMRGAATVLDTRSKALSYTNDLNDISLDKYSLVRSMYMQNRRFVVERDLQGSLSPRCKVVAPTGANNFDLEDTTLMQEEQKAASKE